MEQHTLYTITEAGLAAMQPSTALRESLAAVLAAELEPETTGLRVAIWDQTSASDRPASLTLESDGSLCCVVFDGLVGDDIELIDRLSDIDDWLASLQLRDLSGLYGDAATFYESLLDLRPNTTITLTGRHEFVVLTAHEGRRELLDAELPTLSVSLTEVDVFESSDDGPMIVRRRMVDLVHADPVDVTLDDTMSTASGPIVGVDGDSDGSPDEETTSEANETPVDPGTVADDSSIDASDIAPASTELADDGEATIDDEVSDPVVEDQAASEVVDIENLDEAADALSAEPLVDDDAKTDTHASDAQAPDIDDAENVVAAVPDAPMTPDTADMPPAEPEISLDTVAHDENMDNAVEGAPVDEPDADESEMALAEDAVPVIAPVRLSDPEPAPVAPTIDLRDEPAPPSTGPNYQPQRHSELMPGATFTIDRLPSLYKTNGTELRSVSDEMFVVGDDVILVDKLPERRRRPSPFENPGRYRWDATEELAEILEHHVDLHEARVLHLFVESDRQPGYATYVGVLGRSEETRTGRYTDAMWFDIEPKVGPDLWRVFRKGRLPDHAVPAAVTDS